MVDLEKHKLCSWCGASIRVAVNSMGHHTPQECRTLMHEERTRLLAELTALRAKVAAGDALAAALNHRQTMAYDDPSREAFAADDVVDAKLEAYNAAVKP